MSRPEFEDRMPKPIGVLAEALISVLFGLIWLGGIGSVIAIALGIHARLTAKEMGGSALEATLAYAGIVVGLLGLGFLGANLVK